MPYFSIVVPVYNRAHCVARVLESCIRQDFRDFEVLVVDDDSTDDSVEVIRSFTDPRIKLLRHDKNRGVLPARNTALDAATGEWVVFLDSDDELVPNGLATMHKYAVASSPDIGRMMFMFRVDTGVISPDPPLGDETWDYEDYLRWGAKGLRRSDASNCVRRDLCNMFRFADRKHVASFEALFWLDCSKSMATRTAPECVAIIHTDADNRSHRQSIRQVIDAAQDGIACYAQILSTHGDAMRKICPQWYYSYVRMAALSHVLKGHRLLGTRFEWESLRDNPLSLFGWASLLAGLVGPIPAAILTIAKIRFCRRFGYPRPTS